MLNDCDPQSLVFDCTPKSVPPYAVEQPQIEIVDAMSAKLSAVFAGPPGSQVIGGAWISDADGTMVDGETGEIPAGTRAEMLLTLPRPKVQNGNLIACMRAEWPTYMTRHVIGCTLREGAIVHPPLDTGCEGG